MSVPRLPAVAGTGNLRRFLLENFLPIGVLLLGCGISTPVIVAFVAPNSLGLISIELTHESLVVVLRCGRSNRLH